MELKWVDHWVHMMVVQLADSSVGYSVQLRVEHSVGRKDKKWAVWKVELTADSTALMTVGKKVRWTVDL
jgi:hypothetical protein